MSDSASRRQILFNWLMGEPMDQPDGYWGGAAEVKEVDELLRLLDGERDKALRELVERLRWAAGIESTLPESKAQQAGWSQAADEILAIIDRKEST